MAKPNKYLVYFIAVAVGVVVEFLCLRSEEFMMMLNFPPRIGFSISLFLLIFSPLFTTGVIVYKYTKEIMGGVVLSALTFALALIIFLI